MTSCTELVRIYEFCLYRIWLVSNRPG